MSDLILSPKYKDFLKHEAPVEFLEGTTYAGKTTVGVFKFMLVVLQQGFLFYYLEESRWDMMNLIEKRM